MLCNIGNKMTRDENIQFLHAAIAQLKKTEVKFDETTMLSDLELDSLDIVELQMNYEETYDVIIEDSVSQLLTVADLLNLLQ